MVQCGFNTLVPAFAFNLRIFALYPLGELPTGGLWSNGNGVGTLTSVPGSGFHLNATTVHMTDFNALPSPPSDTGGGGNDQGPYVLAAQGLLRTDDGQHLGLYGRGLLANTPHVRDILANRSGVAPTRWGELDTYTTWTFQAAGKYAALTESTFVANIRVYPSDRSDTVSYIDYRMSKVLPGPPCPVAGGDEEVAEVGDL
ncbi:uncharacterized protein PG986_002327 [Apiospora aurea]|uniref:Uncharacterized protein n=1 Tax=Apiospora aurea TaxID=335848 RepID=A0ABR1QZD9_9PEZI